MSFYYDKEGNPITVSQMIKLGENKDYCGIGLAELSNGTVVSTIWTGLTHGEGTTGPLIFETIVQESGGGWNAQYRYCTEQEALRGHKQRVYEYSDSDDPNGDESRWSHIAKEL